jgi:hypothetical protein
MHPRQYPQHQQNEKNNKKYIVTQNAAEPGNNGLVFRIAIWHEFLRVETENLFLEKTG